jgi:predicted nucleotidyltransferase
MKEITKESILSYLKTIKPYFSEKGIVDIALFGSYSTKRENIYSDIDIAVKKDKDFLQKFNPYDYFRVLNELKDRLRKKFHKNIDIFDLDSSSYFLQDIKKELTYV